MDVRCPQGAKVSIGLAQTDMGIVHWETGAWKAALKRAIRLRGGKRRNKVTAI